MTDKTSPQSNHTHIEGDQINNPHGPVITNPRGDVIIHEADQAHNVQGLASPYLGLAAFTYEERERYAGREDQISAAVAKMTTPGAQQVLLFVTGASGSGKSSFAQAGLLPALEAYYAKRQQTVRWAVMRPSQQPLAMLGDAVQQLGLPVPQLESPPPRTWLPTHTNVVNVIIIDQCEELFTQSQPAQRAVLCDWLSNLPPFADLRTHLIATMRADYLPELFAHQTLYDIAKDGLDLREMTASELREAIQRPLQSCYPDEGKYFEAGLLDRLATDAAADATYLPLLQVTLEQLWDGGTLKLDKYDTLTDAIQDRAEKVYTETANQDALMAIFLDLVEVSLDDDARRDVRRRRTWDELTKGQDERKPLVDDLVSARLLSKDGEQRDGQEVHVVDIIHESLLTNWSGLRKAITAQRERLQRRARFEHWLRDWEKHHRADDYLLESVRLSEAEELAAQRDVALRDPAPRELLERSRVRRAQLQQAELQRQRALAEAQRRRAVLFRQALVVVTTLFIVAVGAGIFASQQQQIANNNAVEAEANAAEARESLALALATTASTWPDDDEAFVLALAAIRLDAYTARTHDLASDVIEQYPLQNVYRHEGPVMSVAFSPDGAWVISGSYDGTLRLWDVRTGKVLQTFKGRGDGVWSVAFSPDGQTILSGSCGSEDGNNCTESDLWLWDVATADVLRTFEAHTDWVGSVAFSPDGQTLLSGSCSSKDGNNCTEGDLRLWDATTGELLQDFEGHTDMVGSVAFSPDGAWVISGSYDGTMRLWDVSTGEMLRTFEGHDNWVASVAYSPDGQTVLSGSGDNTLRLWDVETGERLQTFEGHEDWVESVAFSPDGAWVISGSRDTTLGLWDVETGERLQTFEGHRHGVSSVAFSPDGAWVISGSRDTTLGLWAVSTEEALHTFVHENDVTSVAYSPDGMTVLSGSGDGTLRLWDVSTRDNLRAFIGHEDWVMSMAFSPNGEQVISGSVDGTLHLWDVGTGEVLRIFESHDGHVSSMTFSPDGEQVLSGSYDGTLRLWEVATGKVLQTFEGHEDEVTSVTFSLDGEQVLSGSCNTLGGLFVCNQGELRLWDVTTGAVLQTFEEYMEGIRSVAFSPDGEQVLSGSGDGILQLWDAGTGERLQTFEGHKHVIANVAFSPDGTTILSVSCETRNEGICLTANLRLWDVETGQILRTLTGHKGWIGSIAFSPDGEQVLSGSSDGTMRLWDARPLTEIACTKRYIVPEVEAAMREQFGIPDDLVLCPEE